MANRLSIMRPQLTGEATFIVATDNKIVAQDLQNMRSRIEDFLRKQMQNNKICMQIQIEENQAARRIYSRVEQYQLLEQRNPALKKLKELFELDLE